MSHDSPPSAIIAERPSPIKTNGRVADFQSDSDAESSSSPPDNGDTNAGPSTKRRKIANGDGAGKKRLRIEDTNEARAKRREVSDRLWPVRSALPFYQGRREILEEIMSHDTTIILGETGCGKSTQLPQLLRTHQISLDHYGAHDPHASRFQRGPSIAITQPRRLPTMALANRVSAEMGCLLGGEVGYSVRFEEMSGRGTKLRYMTEGVLMRELANADRNHQATQTDSQTTLVEGSDEHLNLLLRYDIIIIDEAHERTLNTDFLCGALKRIQRIRKRLAAEDWTHVNGASGAKGKGKSKETVKELKLVVMSATLDPGKFQRFFETEREALLVKGRMFNVHTQHTIEPVDDFIETAAKQVLQIHCAIPARDGDVLVFMPGAEEIENCCELLKRAAQDFPDGHMQLQVLQLYSQLAPTQQAKIFAPTAENSRRVIVATNIAETSMTIPGVAFVIDSGYKKEKEYFARASGAIEHLSKLPVSQAAAWQRTGRAGRERDGDCFRLYTHDAFNKFSNYDAPEIQRCNLASAVLHLIAMGLNPFTFEYIDNPGRDNIAAAFTTLAGLGAIDSPTSITPLGREMLRYPLDPEYSRILIASFDLGCPSEIIDVLSLFNAGIVWVDRSSDRDAAATARAKFVHRDGDHLTAMNVLRAYVALKDQDQKSNVKIGRWCKENFVNHKTMVAAVKVRDQLRELAQRNGRDWKVSCGSETELVIRCLLQGLFMNTALIQADGTYKQTAGNLQVKIHPSSVLMSKKVPAILYGELTVTSAIYARTVSAFDQHWLSEVAWFKREDTTVSTGLDKTKL